MFTIKRIDAKATKTPASYELMAYATISDVHEQLSRLGAGNESNWEYVKDEYFDTPAGGLILTASNKRGCIYEVRAFGIYGYNNDNAWRIERVITELKHDARALAFVDAFARKINER